MGQDSSPGGERLAAHHAGLSTFRLGANKRPAVSEWRSFMTDPPDEADIVAERTRTIGYALVCGGVSSRLVVLDFEASFGRERWRELLRRLDGAGLSDNFANWCSGYTVKTPSGGIHVGVHLAGDGPVDGNAKLAFAQGHVIAETRGEGGYVVGPGSNGETHPSGKAWSWSEGSFDDIAWDTPEVFAAVCGIIASFDETPQTATEPSSIGGTTARVPLGGDSWIAAALDVVPPIEHVLTANGWHDTGRRDHYGAHWVRPDKDPRLGHSASLSNNGRLFVHSTNAYPLPTGNPTLDAVDVILCYQLGRRPSPDERVTYLRTFKASAHPGGEVGAGIQAVDARAPSYLGDDFWSARGWLGALRDAAYARMLSPDAVFGAFLSAYATTIPMGIWVPAVVGARAPLNTYCTLVAQSGGGKTAAMSVAADLLGPVGNPDIKLGRGLRSGEGLITEVIKPRPKRKRGDDDPLEDDGPAYNLGVQVHFDEGGTLSRQTERAGSTTIPYLNTAWAGSGTVGGAKASDSGSFPANQVRICAVMGVQFGAAANLFTGESERLGFPQRLLYFGLDDPKLRSIDVDTMSSAPLDRLDLPRYQASEFVRYPQEIGIPLEIQREVRLWTRDKTVDGLTNPLDGHRMNLRLRVAAILALADERFALSEADWDLALSVERTSRSTRGRLVQSLGDISLEQARQRGRLDAVRQEASADLWMEKRAARLYARLTLANDGLSKKECAQVLRGGDERKQLTAILDYMVSQQWVDHRDGRWFPGSRRP
jgi:Bifunctional DNA primase/polymerase, N-terminal